MEDLQTLLADGALGVELPPVPQGEWRVATVCGRHRGRAVDHEISKTESPTR